MTMTQSPTLAPRPAARTKGRNVIAIASGKGGVGKTWFAITLTHALAKRGQRALLFDGDLGLANVDIPLGLMPRHDLGNVIAGLIDPESGDDALRGGRVRCHRRTIGIGKPCQHSPEPLADSKR